MLARERIIVALDVGDMDKALFFVSLLASRGVCFKVGLELITSVGGPEITKTMSMLNGRVFYDGKFNDIPNTIAGAAKAVAKMKVKMFNLHASSGIEGMRAAVANKGQSLVLAVTVLTSLEENNAHLIFGAPSKAKVLQFARDAKLAGCDGIVCSPQELEFLAKNDEVKSLLKVTPGIRASNAAPDDQKRTLTPEEAAYKGADFLVIGRPITTAKDPVEAVLEISAEIARGLKKKLHMLLFNSQKIKFGAFKLKLHEEFPNAPLSPIYMDIRNLSEPAYALIGDILHEFVVRNGIEFDYVIGIPKAGEPIGRALANAIGKPLLRMGKIEDKGSRKISANILDQFEPGKRVILVDDVITKADTKREAINAVKANGLEVAATVVLYDRQQGGLHDLLSEGNHAYAVTTLEDTLSFLVSEKKISSEKMDDVMAYITAK
ncbi:MAG: orotidine-5'-phosphate decarboxylase [Candidatus Paceibacterota bacterium]